MTEVTHHGAISPEYALLGLLLERPSHGYDLHQKFVQELGFVWHVSQSQTYAILKRLETRGHIASKTIEQEKLPPRQMLHVTSLGKKHFMGWLKNPTFRSVRAIRLELITRLFFLSKLSPENIPGYLFKETNRIREVIESAWYQAGRYPGGSNF